MQSKRKSSWKILVVAAAANLLAVTAQAALDAPHGGGTISCLTCHQMTSTYPKLLPPLGGTPMDVEDSYANRTCIKCHKGDGVIKPESIITSTHSRAAMNGNPAYGDWSVECWVCHNEHMQEQNVYNGSTYGMYIRRSINLANIKKPDGTTFGKTGIKPVVFTGPTTFADDISPYNGICEVCHTQTSHFRNDGSGDDHSGKGGSDCIACHNHDTAFAGGAVHNIFIADDSKTGDPATLCSSCHSSYASAPETAHSACAACHTTAPTLLDSTFPTADGQVDDDGTSMFANLAAAGYTFNGTTGRLNDPDGTDITGVGGDGVFAKVKCGVCHAAKPDALAAVPAEHGGHPVTDWDYTLILDDCLDCHADGGLGTVQGVHANDCTLCHVNATGGDFTRKIGDAANGVDGDATLAVGRSGTCLTCHPSATYTKTKIHHDTANAVATPTNGCTTACHNTTTGHAGNHNTLVAIQNPPCQGCHNTAAASGGNNVPVDSVSGNLVHDYCTSCHVNPAGDLIGTVATPTAHATTMNNADGTTATNNGGGTCTACHTAYFDGHAHKTAHTMPTVALCLNCHTATSVPYTGVGEVHVTSNCMTCHDAANGALKGSAVAAVGGENCQGCHTAYFNGHSHAHTMPTVALCTSCHTATAAPYTGSGQVHATGTCATCHDLDATPTGALIGSATGKVGGENCQGCHTTYFDGHGHGGTTATPNHTQTITKDALCGNCHGTGLSGPDAITAPYTAGTEVHSAFGCMTCHSPVNGGPLGTATNWGATWNARASGTCVTCHTAGFAVHPHAHTFTATADCATCHGNPTPLTSNARDAVSAPFVGAGEVHAASSCATCHDAATGALIGSANGHAAATGCIDCHTTTWTVIHTSAAGVTHATRVEPAAACSTCHGNPTPVISNARDAQATPYIAAGNVHETGCGLCHTGNNNGGLKAGPLPKADTVAKGTCTTCHTVTSTWTTIHDTATGAVTGVSHATRVDGLAACTTCHTATAGGAAGVMPYNNGDNKVHDACATCHQGTGALIAGNTTYGNQPIAKGDCGTCHTATYFDSHVHGTTGGYVEHDVTYNALVDLSQVSTPGDNPCGNCHSGNNADGNGVPLNSWADILSEHVTGCARCHSYNDLGDDGIAQGTPPQATNDTTIASGAGVICTTCHTPKLDPNPASDHGYLPHDDAPNRTVVTWTGASGVGTNPDCLVCHDDAGVEVVYSTTTHSGTCATCHAGIPNPLQPATTLATAMPDGGAGTNNGGGSCVVCHAASYEVHTVNNANQAATLHNNVSLTYAETTGCNDCHGVDGVDAGATPLDNWEEIVSLHANCAACHSSDVADVVATIQAGRGNTAGFTGGNTAVDCDDCHITDADVGPSFNVDSAVTPMGHGQTPATVRGEHNMFSASGITGVTDCANCHNMGATDVVANFQKRIELHTSPVSGAANSCLTCHVGQGDPANAQIASGIGGNAVNCNECHTAKGVYTLHGLTEATVADVHDKFGAETSTGEKDCGTCHLTATAENRIDLHANCLYCHDPANTTYVSPTPTTSGTPAPTVVNNGRSTGGNTVQTCESCHAVKNDYALHGLTGDNGTDGVADKHDQLFGSMGSYNDTSATATAIIPKYRSTGYTGSLPYATYGGKLEDSYNCLDCHDIGTNENYATPPATASSSADVAKRLLFHSTDGTVANVKCSWCHDQVNSTDTTWRDQVDTGREAGHHVGGGSATERWCENCHGKTGNYGNATGLSGRAMQQWDGIRHHGFVDGADADTTAEALEGNCTYCHADPRPASTTDKSLNGTETISGFVQTGAWATQHGTTSNNGGFYADDTTTNTDGDVYTVPVEMACQRCHETSANGAVINALDYNPVNVQSDRNTTYEPAGYGIARVTTKLAGVHSLPHTAKINIDNYGACLSCHSVQVWHAKPWWVKDGGTYDDNANDDTGPSALDDTFDVLRYAPGRSQWAAWPANSDDTPDVWAGFDIFAINETTGDSDFFNACTTGVNYNNNTGGLVKLRMIWRYAFNGTNGQKPHNGSGDSEMNFHDTTPHNSRYQENWTCSQNTATNSNPWIAHYGFATDNGVTCSGAFNGTNNNCFQRTTIPRINGINNFKGTHWNMTGNPMVPHYDNDLPPY